MIGFFRHAIGKFDTGSWGSLVSTLDCQSRGRGFKARRARHSTNRTKRKGLAIAARPCIITAPRRRRAPVVWAVAAFEKTSSYAPSSGFRMWPQSRRRVRMANELPEGADDADVAFRASVTKGIVERGASLDDAQALLNAAQAEGELLFAGTAGAELL